MDSIKLPQGSKIIPIPKGYDKFTVFEHGFSKVKAVAVPSDGSKPPIMLLGDVWVEVSLYGR